MGIAVTYGHEDNQNIGIQRTPSIFDREATTTTWYNSGKGLTLLNSLQRHYTAKLTTNAKANANAKAKANANTAGGGKKSPARGTLKTGPKGGKYYVKNGRKVYV